MELDLKDAYYAVPRYTLDSRKCLRFQFKGETYDFRYLPFGHSLAAAPWVFTRVIRQFVVNLRSDEIRTVIYVGDLLLIYHQKDTLREIFLYVRKILSSLGCETNSSLSLFGCSGDQLPCQRNRSIGYREHMPGRTAWTMPHGRDCWKHQNIIEPNSASRFFTTGSGRDQGVRYHCLIPPWRTWDARCPRLLTITTVRT